MTFDALNLTIANVETGVVTILYVTRPYERYPYKCLQYRRNFANASMTCLDSDSTLHHTDLESESILDSHTFRLMTSSLYL